MRARNGRGLRALPRPEAGAITPHAVGHRHCAPSPRTVVHPLCSPSSLHLLPLDSGSSMSRPPVACWRRPKSCRLPLCARRRCHPRSVAPLVAGLAQRSSAQSDARNGLRWSLRCSSLKESDSLRAIAVSPFSHRQLPPLQSAAIEPPPANPSRWLVSPRPVQPPGVLAFACIAGDRPAARRSPPPSAVRSGRRCRLPPADPRGCHVGATSTPARPDQVKPTRASRSLRPHSHARGPRRAERLCVGPSRAASTARRAVHRVPPPNPNARRVLPPHGEPCHRQAGPTRDHAR